MRVLALLLVVACGPKDECAEIKSKLMAVFEPMFAEQGKTMPPQLEAQLGELCKHDDPESRKLRTCALESSSTAEVAACIQPLFEAVADESRGRMKRLDAAMERLRNPPDASVPTVDAAVAIAIADAAMPDAPPPVDVATLAAWPLVDRTRGAETEVFAIDAPADQLIVPLAKRNLLMLPSGAKVTGRVKAPSPQAALAALAGHAKLELPVSPRVTGKAPAIDLSFADASAADVFRVCADTARTNIVIIGELPKVNLHLKRVPADAVMSELAALVNRKLVKAKGIVYVTDKPLPTLPALAGAGLTVSARDATADQVMAAIRAVMPVPVSVCGGDKVSLRLRDVSLAEAVRAISLSANAAITQGNTCPIGETKDIDGVALVAIASTKTKRAATVVEGGTAAVVSGVEGTEWSIAVGNVELAFVPPDVKHETLEELLAGMRRTAAVIRIGKTWSALVEHADGRLTGIYDKSPVGRAFDMTHVIDRTGVTFTTPDRSVHVPLR